jgi:hypothetical protein
MVARYKHKMKLWNLSHYDKPKDKGEALVTLRLMKVK